MKVSFWEDRWIAQRTLKQLFLDLYTPSYQQNATVADMWTGQEGALAMTDDMET